MKNFRSIKNKWLTEKLERNGCCARFFSYDKEDIMFNKEDKRSYKNMTIAEAIALSEEGFALLLEDGTVKDIVKESKKEA